MKKRQPRTIIKTVLIIASIVIAALAARPFLARRFAAPATNPTAQSSPQAAPQGSAGTSQGARQGSGNAGGGAGGSAGSAAGQGARQGSGNAGGGAGGSAGSAAGQGARQGSGGSGGGSGGSAGAAAGQGTRQGSGSSGTGARQGGAGRPARAATAVRVTEVVRGTIENSVKINGDVLAANRIAIYPTVAGKVASMRYQIGDTVSQGATVAMIDPSRPGQVFSESPVVSTVGGTVLETPVHRGDTVTTQTAVLVVGDLSSLVIETFVPERFSNAARRGLGAAVVLEALPGISFRATVDEVSPVLDPASRTVRIRLRFEGSPDPRIKAGMFATVSLVTLVHTDVPIIPRGSVINTYGSWIVFTVNDRGVASRRVVQLGIENESFIEVLSGLEIGDIIVTEGQNFLSDGDSVRVVE